MAPVSALRRGWRAFRGKLLSVFGRDGAARLEAAHAPNMVQGFGGLGALLSERDWQAFVVAGATRHFREGEALLRQGDPGTHVLILSSGHVKVTRGDAAGYQVLLALRGPGEILGEIAVLDGTERSATVVALDNCVTYALLADRFRRMIEVLGLRDVVFRHLLARYREGEEVRAELADLPASQRVVRVLIRLSDAFSGSLSQQVELPLSQEELAHAAGLSRSATAGELAELRGKGLISTGRRRLVVHQLGALRMLAENGER